MTDALLPVPARSTSLSLILPSEALAERAAQAEHDARGTTATNTGRAYEVGRRAFACWCASQGIEPTLPVAPRVLANFVDGVMVEVRRKGEEPRLERPRPATVETYLHAVNSAHRLLDLPVPGSANVVRLALTRLRRS